MSSSSSSDSSPEDKHKLVSSLLGELKILILLVKGLVFKLNF